MYRNDRSPLPPWIEDAYETLADEIDQQEGGIATARAQALLYTVNLIEDEADVHYAIDRLLNRGYLYTVEGELFVTEPDQ